MSITWEYHDDKGSINMSMMTVSVDLTTETRDKLYEMAEEMGISRAKLIRQVLEAFSQTMEESQYASPAIHPKRTARTNRTQ